MAENQKNTPDQSQQGQSGQSQSFSNEESKRKQGNSPERDMDIDEREGLDQGADVSEGNRNVSQRNQQTGQIPGQQNRQSMDDAKMKEADKNEKDRKSGLSQDSRSGNEANQKNQGR